MAKRLNDNIYRAHIISACKRLKRYTRKKTFDQFRKDEMLQAAVIRELEIIGEATKHLSAAFRGRHSNIPWRSVAGMRDVAIHDYFKLELPIIWVTAIRRVPEILEYLIDKE